jgi:hypothetical protein
MGGDALQERLELATQILQQNDGIFGKQRCSHDGTPLEKKHPLPGSRG